MIAEKNIYYWTYRIYLGLGARILQIKHGDIIINAIKERMIL